MFWQTFDDGGLHSPQLIQQFDSSLQHLHLMRGFLHLVRQLIPAFAFAFDERNLEAFHVLQGYIAVAWPWICKSQLSGAIIREANVRCCQLDTLLLFFY
jgi:hypothetical protein